MAENQSINIPAHHNIYKNSMGRELRIDFSYPTAGINKETGLLILVPGFGGNIDSKVYKKMREIFADRYNLVTLQCTYFGDSYMQGIENIIPYNTDEYVKKYLSTSQQTKIQENPSLLLNYLSSISFTLPVMANIKESKDEFNDMGFMQAIDLITAIEAIIIILKDNSLNFNERKIIGYGHSHGAYLLHLANRMSPYLFSTIIDNSAWIEPVYLSSNRYLYQRLDEMTLKIEFDYLAKRIIKDKKALNLSTLYKRFKNQTEIISFQGTDDNLVDHVEKQNIIKGIENAKFILIGEEDVDQAIFKSNRHGLDADFLKMFDHAYNQCLFENNQVDRKQGYSMNLSKTTVNVDYSQGLPLFQFG